MTKPLFDLPVLAQQVRTRRDSRKGEPRKRTKARKDRAKHAHVKAIRKQVFTDHGDRCVVCGWRAESMHEKVPASIVGDRVKATTRENSIPVCGSGTTKCHGLLQRYVVRPIEINGQTRYFVDVNELRQPDVRALSERVELRRLSTLLICT